MQKLKIIFKLFKKFINNFLSTVRLKLIKRMSIISQLRISKDSKETR